MTTMTARTPKPEEKGEDRLLLPLDLSEWVPRALLLKWIREKLETLNWSNLKLVEYLNAHPQYRPKELLTLLTFAYATGTFESEEIAILCVRNADFSAICGDFSPTARSIARFRRENRGLLKWSLSELLKQTLKARFELGNPLLPAGLRQVLLQMAIERLDLARHLDRAGYDA